MTAAHDRHIYGRQGNELFEEDAALLDRILIDATLRFHLYDYKAALAILDPIVLRIERPGHVSPYGWSDSRQQRYVHFSEAFHADVYERFHLPEGHRLHVVMDDVPGMYRLRGMCLRRLGRLPEGQTSLERAITWGPVEMSSRRELVALLKERGEFDEAFNVAREALALSPSLEDFLAFCTELALLATEREELRLAMALSAMVMQADPSGHTVGDVVAYLQRRRPDWQNHIPSSQEIAESLGENDLPIAPDARYCALALDKAREALGIEHYGERAYYLAIATRLAPSEELVSALHQASDEAARRGQRTDGRDGFWLSGTFISGMPGAVEPGWDAEGDAVFPGGRETGSSSSGTTPEGFPEVEGGGPLGSSVESGGRQARTRGEDVSQPFDPDGSGGTEGLVGHDHRLDDDPRGDGQAPNALGGVPGVAYPGMPAPYDGRPTRSRHRGNPSGGSSRQ